LGGEFKFWGGEELRLGGKGWERFGKGFSKQRKIRHFLGELLDPKKNGR